MAAESSRVYRRKARTDETLVVEALHLRVEAEQVVGDLVLTELRRLGDLLRTRHLPKALLSVVELRANPSYEYEYCTSGGGPPERRPSERNGLCSTSAAAIIPASDSRQMMFTRPRRCVDSMAAAAASVGSANATARFSLRPRAPAHLALRAARPLLEALARH